jgi:AcrR family transcriptional regulator
MARQTSEVRRDAPEVDELPASQRARRDRIVETAVELLGTDDYEKIHMRLVADRAGVALGTLYRYFPSKERLFATALIRWAQTFQQSYERTIRSSESDPAERVRRTMHVALKAFERNPRFFGLLMALQVSDDPEVAALYERYTGTTSRVVRDALDGIDERWIEPIETLVWAAVFNLLRRWSLGRMPMSEVRSQLDDCIDVIFSTPTGARLAG